jgi:hypothetical protein
MEHFIKPENKVSEREIISPSNKYKLIISRYKTGEDTWDYSNGKIIRLSDNKEIASINRNYPAFTHTWFYKNNNEWLQTGSTYMSQTFVNLDTGVIYDNTEELNKTDEYNEGFSFCWRTVSISPDGNTLAVFGCYWACPDEYRFYDFTSPDKGWYELDNECNNSDDMEGHWNTDGTFNMYERNTYIEYNGKLINVNKDYEEYLKIPESVLKDSTKVTEREMDEQIITLKRQDDKIIIVKIWQSEKRN